MEDTSRKSKKQKIIPGVVTKMIFDFDDITMFDTIIYIIYIVMFIIILVICCT